MKENLEKLMEKLENLSYKNFDEDMIKTISNAQQKCDNEYIKMINNKRITIDNQFIDDNLNNINEYKNSTDIIFDLKKQKSYLKKLNNLIFK